MKTHIVLLGPPGAGKGTQGQLLGKSLNVPFISSGDALRVELSENSEIGKKFKKYINSGLLVPDNVVEEFIENMLNKYSLAKGFVFDGFPRTVHQASFLSDYLNKKRFLLEAVIYLSISDEDIVKRISGRRICPNCGAVYNIYFNSPKENMNCDICGVELMQREDDKEEVVRKRIEVYKQETLPLINYYKGRNLIHEISGLGSVAEVQSRILEALND
ncbi:MAG: adenylate kinase [Nitrospiraceae bacterium]|nr:adenylate kinase [Nitrospiraceae bacterium]